MEKRQGVGHKQKRLRVLSILKYSSYLSNLRYYRNYYRMKTVRLQSKASDIKFKHIGNRLISKATRRSVMSSHQLPEGQSRHPEEIDPCQFQDFEWSQKLKVSMYKYALKEDTRVSRFTHRQLLLVEKNILVLALLVIFLGMIKIQADVLFPSGSVSESIMMVIGCTTFMLIFLVGLRKVLGLQLDIDQRRVYARRDDREHCKSGLQKLMRDRHLFGGLILEILVILPHPSKLFQGLQYTSFDENRSLNFVYEVNDVLNVFMMVKIYLVFRSLVAMSIYTSPRAVRLCSYSNIDHTWFFSTKCIQQEYPLAFTTVVSLVFMFIIGIGFRVTEGNLYYLNSGILPGKTGFEDYSTCLWFTFITMTSIGYGQYSPISPMGRLLAGFIAIFGVILNSFLVVALTQYLRMKTGEIRSHTTMIRLGQQKTLFKQSANVLAETIETTQLISKHKLDNFIIKKLKPLFETLKIKIDFVKSHSKHIKSILPQSNKTELMIHQFQLVKDNFKEVYKMQKKMKSRIERIEELKGRKVNIEVRKRFMEEVNCLLDCYQP